MYVKFKLVASIDYKLEVSIFFLGGGGLLTVLCVDDVQMNSRVV